MLLFDPFSQKLSSIDLWIHFGCLLARLDSHFAPLGDLLAPNGSLLVYFGAILVTLGSIFSLLGSPGVIFGVFFTLSTKI